MHNNKCGCDCEKWSTVEGWFTIHELFKSHLFGEIYCNQDPFEIITPKMWTFWNNEMKDCALTGLKISQVADCIDIKLPGYLRGDCFCDYIPMGFDELEDLPDQVHKPLVTCVAAIMYVHKLIKGRQVDADNNSCATRDSGEVH